LIDITNDLSSAVSYCSAVGEGNSSIVNSSNLRDLQVSSACSADATSLVALVIKAIDDLSASNYGILVTDAQTLITKLLSTVTDCTTGNGSCLSDLLALLPEITQIQADVKAADLTAVIADITAIAPVVTALTTDCA